MSRLSELRLYLCNAWVAHVPSHLVRLAFYRRVMRYDIAPTASVFMGAIFDCAGNLSIGDGSTVNARCRLDTRGGLRIGRCVSISDDCRLLTADHDPRDPAFGGRQRGIDIEDHVWLGSSVIVLPGVRLGQGCVVGAGAVVTRDVAPFAIVAGNPARQIGERPRDLNYRADYRRWFH